MKILVVGAGITGITIAQQLNEQGVDVTVIEKRPEIGGNCRDHFEDGNYIQDFGPHIFHTKDPEVWQYVNKFTKFNNYRHRVFALIDGKYIDVPFNLNSIAAYFPAETAAQLTKILINEVGEGAAVPVMELRKHPNELVRQLAEVVYEKVFLGYTVKQWGHTPEELHPSVTARVPVKVTRENRYFTDPFEGVPVAGYTPMFERMLEGIDLRLGVDFKDLDLSEYDKVFYTGPLDELFGFKFGPIKYRKVRFEIEKHNTSSYQPVSQVNYPNSEAFTRITEGNKFLFINNSTTTIMKEYASWDEGFGAYPLQTDENTAVVQRYLQEAKQNDRIILVGRLAECRYYNMDQAVRRGLDVAKELLESR